MTNKRLREMAEVNQLDGYEKLDLYNFKNVDNGKLTDDALKKAANGMDWVYLNDNSSVVLDSERGKVLQVKYPKGAVGPNTIGYSGSQFIKSI